MDAPESQAQPAPRIDVDKILADGNADRKQLSAAVSQCTSDLADIDKDIDLLKRDRREQPSRTLKGSIRADIDDLKDSRQALSEKIRELEYRIRGDVYDHDVAKAARNGKDASWVKRNERRLLSTLRSIPTQIQDKAENAESAATREANAGHLRELLRIRDMARDSVGQTAAAVDFLQGYRRVLHAKISGTEATKAEFIAAFLDAVRALQGGDHA